MTCTKERFCQHKEKASPTLCGNCEYWNPDPPKRRGRPPKNKPPEAEATQDTPTPIKRDLIQRELNGARIYQVYNLRNDGVVYLLIYQGQPIFLQPIKEGE